MHRPRSDKGRADCTGEVLRQPVATMIGMALLVLLCLPATAMSQTAYGSVQGVVRDADGLALAGVEMELAGRQRRERSDSLGRFSFGAVPAGTAQFTARRLGYRPGFAEVQVMAGSTSELALNLTPTLQNLAPVVVRERREVYDGRLAGFYSRLESGQGYVIGRERIAEATSSSFTDLLRAEVPGVRIGSLGGMVKAVRLRGSRCAPLVFLDGVPATAGEFDVDMLEVSTLEGIEVYHGLASVPPEFMGTGMQDRCGVIAVWTHPTPRERRAPRPRSDGKSGTLEQLVARGDVFTAADVDVTARLDSESFSPSYPDSLWRAGTGGRVVAEFVVSDEGDVEPGTVRIVASSNVLLDAAVRAALLDASFEPAHRRDRAVRQLVQLPVVFEFSEERPATAARPTSIRR